MSTAPSHRIGNRVVATLLAAGTIAALALVAAAANINSEQMRSSFGAHGTLWGGSSDHGEDYGIGW